MIISEIKAAVDLTKSIADAMKAAKNYDPQLLESFNELRGKVLGAYNVETDLRQRIEELEKELALKKMVPGKDPVAYYAPDDTERKAPFCQRCLDANQKLCRLHEMELAYHCTVCNLDVCSSAQLKIRRENMAALNARKRRW